MSEQDGLKIAFAGTPDFAALHLAALIQSRHEIVSVYTQPDRPAGRGKKLQSSAVKQVAMSAELEVRQPQSLNDANEQQALAALDADILIVVAYGLLLPKTILNTPRLGCVNVHASLLPRWRGAAPVQRAIEAGDSETGITIMQMEEGLDTGDILLSRACQIQADDTAASLLERLEAIGPTTLLEALEKLAHSEITPTPQDDSAATYARKLSKQEALIDWTQDAHVIERRVRAFNPNPMAYTLLDGEPMRILRATAEVLDHSQPPGYVLSTDANIHVACGEGTALAIELMQLPGKKPMPAKEVLNGSRVRFSAGKQLGY